ncbi:MAG: hypothetical protein IK123_09535, partial [Lachnospiraceae bacterium]|nr:hypothetical protein [Lachnospiraceae bacterium]
MKIRKRLLRGIAGIFAGVCALSLSKNMAMAASVNVATSLADFNQGAAQILDSLEYAEDNEAAIPAKGDVGDAAEEE